MKLVISLAAAATVAGGFAVLPAPATAQAAQSEVVVYGSDPCPRQTESNIVVCVHRPETERYRLPKSQQLQGPRQERQSWAKQSQAVTNVGKTGINSPDQAKAQAQSALVNNVVFSVGIGFYLPTKFQYKTPR